jgi:histidine ammonia-lyase
VRHIGSSVRHVPYMDRDRELYIDIESMVNVIRSGEIVKAVENSVGEIKGIA